VLGEFSKTCLGAGLHVRQPLKFPDHTQATYADIYHNNTSPLITAGTAHVTAIILCVIRIALARQTKGAEKYRLRGSARLVHCCAATAAAANLLLVLFLLNGRIAADTILVVHGKVAPFEWVGESTQMPVA